MPLPVARESDAVLFLLKTDLKMLHQKGNACNKREKTGYPDGEGKADEKVETEDDEEQSKEEVRHGQSSWLYAKCVL